MWFELTNFNCNLNQTLDQSCFISLISLTARFFFSSEDHVNIWWEICATVEQSVSFKKTLFTHVVQICGPHLVTSWTITYCKSKCSPSHRSNSLISCMSLDMFLVGNFLSFHLSLFLLYWAEVSSQAVLSSANKESPTLPETFGVSTESTICQRPIFSTNDVSWKQNKV